VLTVNYSNSCINNFCTVISYIRDKNPTNNNNNKLITNHIYNNQSLHEFKVVVVNNIYILFGVIYLCVYIMDTTESQMAKIKIKVFPEVVPITSHKSHFNPHDHSAEIEQW